MDRLPNELIPMLFGYLELADLINCRAVSKRFRYFADRTRIEELIVASSPALDQKKSWFVTRAMIDIGRNAISPSAFNGCRFVFNLAAHLKRLCLSFENNLGLNMAILDRMRIEQLDVKCSFLASNQAVELPDLKGLELSIANEDEGSIFFVQAPKLTKLRTSCLLMVHLDSPEALLYLDTHSGLDLCKQFKNLEVLRVRFLDKKILTTFERLKRLEIVGRSDDEAFRKRLRVHLKYLVKQAKVLKRIDLQLYFHGVRLVDGHELDDLPERLELQLRNYGSLADADLSFVTEIDHSDLTRLLNESQLDALPTDFFSTFFNIQKVTTSAPVEKDRFFRFIQSCPYLTDLALVNSALGKRFVELPKYCDLKRLIVEEPRYVNINFDFILKFSRLQFFDCSVYCSGSFFSLAILSFQRLPELFYFKFRTLYSSDFVKIGRDEYLYDVVVSCDSGGNMTTEVVRGLDKLVELCVKTKYRNLDHSSWAKEIIYLSKFYKPATDH